MRCGMLVKKTNHPRTRNATKVKESGTSLVAMGATIVVLEIDKVTPGIQPNKIRNLKFRVDDDPQGSPRIRLYLNLADRTSATLS